MKKVKKFLLKEKYKQVFVNEVFGQIIDLCQSEPNDPEMKKKKEGFKTDFQYKAKKNIEKANLWSCLSVVCLASVGASLLSGDNPIFMVSAGTIAGFELYRRQKSVIENKKMLNDFQSTISEIHNKFKIYNKERRFGETAFLIERVCSKTLQNNLKDQASKKVEPLIQEHNRKKNKPK